MPASNRTQAVWSVTFSYGSRSRSAPLTTWSGSDYFCQWPSRWQLIMVFFCFLLFEATFTSFCQRSKVIKKSQKSEKQGFSYNFGLKDPDPDLILMDPDPGGPKTYVSGSATLDASISSEDDSMTPRNTKNECNKRSRDASKSSEACNSMREGQLCTCSRDTIFVRTANCRKVSNSNSRETSKMQQGHRMPDVRDAKNVCEKLVKQTVQNKRKQTRTTRNNCPFLSDSFKSGDRSMAHSTCGSYIKPNQELSMYKSV